MIKLKKKFQNVYDFVSNLDKLAIDQPKLLQRTYQSFAINPYIDFSSLYSCEINPLEFKYGDKSIFYSPNGGCAIYGLANVLGV